MNKQEIIDKLRLEISERDMALIDLQERLRIGTDALMEVEKVMKNYPEYMGTAGANCLRLIVNDAIKEMAK